MRSEQEAIRAVNMYADTVKRICLIYLKNSTDTEDVFQTVFLKYITKDTEFENEENEKAWFIRVSINACKDFMKNSFRSKRTAFDDLNLIGEEMTLKDTDTLNAVLSLPLKYKQVIYLHYYEGYTANEISKIISKKPNTVYTLITRAKNMLKEKLKGEI